MLQKYWPLLEYRLRRNSRKPVRVLPVVQCTKYNEFKYEYSSTSTVLEYIILSVACDDIFLLMSCHDFFSNRPNHWFLMQQTFD